MARGQPAGAVRVDLVAFSGKFVKAIKEAQTRLTRFRNYARRINRKMAGSFKRVSAAVAGITAAIGLALKSMTSYSSKLVETSRATGIATKQLEGLRALFKGDGIGINKTDKAFAALNNRIGQAAMGFGSAKRSLDTLGISVTDVNGKTRPTNEIFNEVAGKISKMGSASEATALLFDMMGNDAKWIAPIIMKYGDNLEAAAKHAGRFRTLTSEQHELNKELGQSFEDTQTNVTDLVQKGLALAAPQIKVIADEFNRWVSAIKDNPGFMEGLQSFVEGLAKGLSFVAKVMATVITGFGYMFKAVKSIAEKIADLFTEDFGEAQANWIEAKERLDAHRARGPGLPGMPVTAAQRLVYEELEKGFAEDERSRRAIYETKKMAARAAQSASGIDTLIAKLTDPLKVGDVSYAVSTTGTTTGTPISSTNVSGRNLSSDMGRATDHYLSARAYRQDPQMAFGDRVTFPARRSRPNPYGMSAWDKAAMIGLPSKEEIKSLISYVNELNRKAIRKAQKETIRVAGMPLPRSIYTAGEAPLPIFGLGENTSRGGKERSMHALDARRVDLNAMFRRMGKEAAGEFDAGLADTFRKSGDLGTDPRDWRINEWMFNTAMARKDGVRYAGRTMSPIERIRMGQYQSYWMNEGGPYAGASRSPLDAARQRHHQSVFLNAGGPYAGRSYSHQDRTNMAMAGIHGIDEGAKLRLEELKPIVSDIRGEFNQMGRSIIDNFDNAKDAAKSFGKALLNMFFERSVMGPLGNVLFGAAGGSGLGIVGSILGAFSNPFAGGKGIATLADGGMGRGMTLVGERGPELVDFSAPAMVTSNERIRAALGGGSGGAVFNISINSTDGPGVERALANWMPYMTDLASSQVAERVSRPGTFRSTVRGRG